ncbi:RNase adaptor protein RapZ, partial [Shewanella sp. C31]|nr:RNase adaptor protein RapZ [Shewanella electrica]
MRVLVLSGLSGAGKTTAKGFLEDLGYFMVDNLPPGLWKPLLEELAKRGVERAGVVLDARAL